jgi:GTP-binding protein
VTSLERVARRAGIEHTGSPMNKSVTPQVPAIVSARYLGGAPVVTALPPPVALEVAFAGRSNVGKSSLLNALAGQKKLARTSSTPGCTRQIACFEVRGADGSILHLVDLPGYGYAQRSQAERAAWGPLIEDYLTHRPTLRCLVLLVDARRGLESEEHQLLDFLAHTATKARPPVTSVLVATKLDKLPPSRQKSALAAIEQATGRTLLGFSTRRPEAVMNLWQAIRHAVGMELPAPSSESTGDAATQRQVSLNPTRERGAERPRHRAHARNRRTR